MAVNYEHRFFNNYARANVINQETGDRPYFYPYYGSDRRMLEGEADETEIAHDHQHRELADFDNLALFTRLGVMFIQDSALRSDKGNWYSSSWHNKLDYSETYTYIIWMYITIVNQDT